MAVHDLDDPLLTGFKIGVVLRGGVPCADLEQQRPSPTAER
ncbi:MAG: hypothetical protein ACRDS0_24480 [Pseudonocardiaceae bacterium]